MRRLALVEDSPDNRMLVCAILGDSYAIDEYENGRAALAGIKAHRPELVLLDMTLPEMDGTEVLAALRADASLRELPVIALTGHAKAGNREKYVYAGFDDYVTKPIIDDEALLAAVGRQLH